MSAESELVDIDGLVAMLREDDRLFDALERAVLKQQEALESGKWDQYEHSGFGAGDVGWVGWEVKKFQQTGILGQAYKSSNSSYYRLGRRDESKPEGEQWTHFTEEAERALELASGDEPHVNGVTEEDLEAIDPDALFVDVVGRDQVIKWLRRTIRRKAQIHHLLAGPSGSGKSMMLADILELPGAARFVGAGRQSTAAGISNFLLENRPHWLVVEEIEKMPGPDAEALLTLMGRGYIETTKGSGEQEQHDLPTTVFANANDLDRVSPDSLLSRMMVWEFDRYSLDEFVNVCTTVLPRDHDIQEDLAKYIAERVFHDLDSADVRDAERISELAETPEEADELVLAMGSRQSNW